MFKKKKRKKEGRSIGNLSKSISSKLCKAFSPLEHIDKVTLGMVATGH